MSELQGARRFSEVIDDVWNMAQSAWRFRWKGIIVIWVMCLIGWVSVLSMPNIYSASSRLFVDTQTSLQPLLQGLAINTDMVGESLIMARSLKSRPNLERIAAVAGLTLSDAEPGEVRAVITRLENDLTITLDDSQVLNIKYQNTEPLIALSIVAQLVDLFIDGLLGENRSDGDSARGFLVTKIRDYEELLNQAERRLAEFKIENIGLMPDERGDYFARLQLEQVELDKLDLKLNVARQRQAELNRQLEGESPVFGMVSPSPAVNESAGVGSVVGRQIMEYEQELGRLRIQYTDSHPDIVRIIGILEDLRAQRIEDRQNSGGGMSRGGGSLNENPVFQSMRLQLSSVELKLVQFQTKRNSQAKVVNDLRTKVDIIPDIEARLKKLNRNYEVNKAQYDALLQRLESARMTEAAEKSKNKLDFRIIDPPSVTPTPVGPNRELFMSIVLILAMGAGAAFMLLMSFVRPVFFSMRELEETFGIPVLGGIKYIPSVADTAMVKKNMLFFIGSCISIFGGYGVAVIFSRPGSEFVGRIIFNLGSIL
jgi:polysaccharide chain length determinant protein (PEP-CTERM system associated)